MNLFGMNAKQMTFLAKKFSYVFKPVINNFILETFYVTIKTQVVTSNIPMHTRFENYTVIKINFFRYQFYNFILMLEYYL